ncbi:peptide/nickel transport system ATP-binding protein [Marinitoga hydrogenitolerans DSM 16785]|uniref:Peptide/nickel transport system ATP-binding protein n=1 Tax=Marinitoga hydrogenitolerans (strain DSM 16785 / JCM 12826 / AT1271) TaxID=1122195 RepID=A0A1M4XQ74_MARH1|nr:ABC transporter ATP-binding protein [Marinitoga hydrogenitolerans]SHE95578.1 peptide/nickel transport system ATP-binding protein [Marinitoga hydrogenitolerans DSM 16785]
MEKILNVKNLKIYYKTLKGYVKAIDDVSFDINKGEILGIAGESGCGKSTLGNSLILLKPPMNYISGKVLLNNKNIINLPKKEMKKIRYEKISIIPQYAMDAFSPTKKIKTFISDLVKEHGITPDENFFNKVKKRLELVNLNPNVIEKYSVELSGGMKQRVIMVISTLLDPDLLIADEVTSALDVSSQRFVCDMLIKFRNMNIVKSMIFITHDIGVLYQIADRIMIMYAGKIAEIGKTENILNHPKHPYTKALINSIPKSNIRIKKEKLESIDGTPPNLLNIEEGCRFRFR